MEGHEHQVPYRYTYRFDGDGYKVAFSRYDGYLQHSICHLDIVSNDILGERSSQSALLLETSPWQVVVVCSEDSPDSLPFIICAATSMMYPLGRPLCGFRVNSVPWEMALRLIDGFKRSGNLMLHIFMRDMAGEGLEIEVPILPNALSVVDPTGILAERLLSYVRRN